MLKSTRLVFFVLAALLLGGAPVFHATQASADKDRRSDEQAIELMMQRFHESVVAHDGTTLASLFLPDATVWLNVLTDAAYDRARTGDSKALKVRFSSYRDFAKFVSTTPKSLDAEHKNVVIHTDGTIAAVYFDFVFKVDGKDESRGSETWQLVKTSDGWRIAAISYSSDPVH